MQIREGRCEDRETYFVSSYLLLFHQFVIYISENLTEKENIYTKENLVSTFGNDKYFYLDFVASVLILKNIL